MTGSSPSLGLHEPLHEVEGDLGYLAAWAAKALVDGDITGAEGDTFTAGDLGDFTVGADATVLALGPVLDDVLAATADRDLTVLYAHSVRPFDVATQRSIGRHANVDLTPAREIRLTAYGRSRAEVARELEHERARILW